MPGCENDTGGDIAAAADVSAPRLIGNGYRSYHRHLITFNEGAAFSPWLLRIVALVAHRCAPCARRATESWVGGYRLPLLCTPTETACRSPGPTP